MSLKERGKIIREARKSKKYTVLQMASKMFMSEGTYKKIESGEKDPTTQECKLLMEILDLHPYIFYCRNCIKNINKKELQDLGNFDTKVFKIESEKSNTDYKHEIETSMNIYITKMNELVSNIKVILERLGK